MLKKVLLVIGAVVLFACVSDLFAEEGPIGPGPERKGLQRRGRAAKELRKYEREMRAEKKGFKRDKAERFEGWCGRGRWRDGYGKKIWRRSWQKSKFGQGWGRRGGGRGFGGRGIESWCPWGWRGGAGDYRKGWHRGGRGMRRPRGRGGRSFGPRMGMRGRGFGFGRPGMGRGGGRGFGPGGMHGYGMQKGHGARGMRGPWMRGQGMRRPWMRGRGSGFGYGRRGPAKRQGRVPAESDFDWDW